MTADGKRLFVGIRPAIATVAELGEVCETLARRAQTANVPIKWIAPASYHVTVKFLGWARAEIVPAVIDAVRAAAAIAPFTFTTARLGAFPARDRASVVWAGVDCEPIARLARALDESCAQLGFGKDKRAFHGHVTLGRLRDQKPASEVILPFAEQVFSDTRVTAITLFESITKPTGSEYLRVADLALGQPPDGQKRQSRGVQSQLETIDTDDGWPRGQGPSSED